MLNKYLCLPLKEHTELEALNAAKRLMTEAGMTPAQQADIQLAMIESIINAVEHSHARDNKIHIRFFITPDAFKVVVEDHGKGFDPSRIAPVDFRAKRRNGETRGWGLYLIREAMDEVSILSDQEGTKLEMLKKREKTV